MPSLKLEHDALLGHLMREVCGSGGDGSRGKPPFVEHNLCLDANNYTELMYCHTRYFVR